MEKAVSDRVSFVQAEKIYFGCLQPGHFSKSCKTRIVCDMCHKLHPTCLHEERNKDNGKSSQVKQRVSQERSRMNQEGHQGNFLLLQHKEINAVATSNRVILSF